MKITITGATGFIGAHLLARLRSGGHELRVLGRRPVAGLPYSEWPSTAVDPPGEALASADAIIHLAGEPIAQRWTASAKRRIRESRVEGTRRIVRGLSTLSRRPAVLVCASAVGFYGSRGDEELTENSPPGSDFLAEVTTAWEREADIAQTMGVRVVKMRNGAVLGKGGALAKMLPPFRLGLGGPLGSGRQWMSWIHVLDVVELMAFAVEAGALRGPVNVVSPNPVRNRVFTKELAGALHRPAWFPVPAVGLKLLFGEMAEVLLASQRALPKAATAAGYNFRFPDLEPALISALQGPGSVSSRNRLS